MSQQSNISKINYSTAFETDKACATLVGSYAANSYDSILGGFLYQKNIPHNFTRPVLCDALFSSNGTNYVPNGQTDGSTVGSNVYSDANNISLLSYYNTGTIYYKIVCTWIDNYDSSNPLITPIFQNSGHNVTTFDSRENYQKLDLNSSITLTTAVGTTPIAHNLGYAPNYKLFFESLPGQVWPGISGGVANIWLYDVAHQIEIAGTTNTTNLNLLYDGGVSSAATFKAWYKVYY